MGPPIKGAVGSRPSGRPFPQPPEHRRFRFLNPFLLGTISESGDNTSTFKTTPLVEDKSVEPSPGNGVAGIGEENDNSGESFFEGFHNDTELYDGTHLIISLASHGQVTVVGRRQAD